MAAVLNPSSTATAPWHRPEVAPRPRPTARPDLRVLPGGRAAVRQQRRAGRSLPLGTLVSGVVLALVVALALVGALHLAGAGAAASGPAPTAATPAAPAAPQAGAPAEIVVQPGDTLWGIARTLKPTGDVRELVDRLAERAGGAELQPGQHLDVHGLG